MIDPVSLAKLAADERTPGHERAAAAMALAKLVAKHGMPALGQAERESAFDESQGTPRQMNDLRRQLDALTVIAGQQAAELRALRADKTELEARLAQLARGARDA